MAITLSPCNHERREIKEINENKIKLIKLTATSESHVIGPSAPCHRRHCSAPLLTHEVILVSPADVMPSSNRVVRMKGTNKIIATGTETFKRKSWVVCGSRVQRSLSRNVRAYPKLASDKSGRRVRFPTKKIKCKVAKFRQFIASKFLSQRAHFCTGGPWNCAIFLRLSTDLCNHLDNVDTQELFFFQRAPVASAPCNRCRLRFSRFNGKLHSQFPKCDSS